MMAIGQVKWNAARGVYQAEYRDCEGKRRYVSDKKAKERLRKLKDAQVCCKNRWLPTA